VQANLRAVRPCLVQHYVDVIGRGGGAYKSPGRARERGCQRPISPRLGVG
jgi:hypothetical protein